MIRKENMKYEFVEFYQTKKAKNFLGTVHIYMIDIQLDIRGIGVIKKGKNLFFSFPHFKAVNSDTNDVIQYPFIRFANDIAQKELIDFLKNVVKPEILKRLTNGN